MFFVVSPTSSLTNNHPEEREPCTQSPFPTPISSYRSLSSVKPTSAAPISRENSFCLLDAFTAGGGNLVDTASVYANWLGERSISEKTIGAWLKRSGKRNRVVIATKGTHRR